MRQVLVLVAVLALAACGSERSGTQEVAAGDASEAGDAVTATIETDEGTARMRSGADVPVDLPRGFSIFPGAEVASNTVFDQAGSKGALLTMESDAPAAEMIAFYRRQAEAAGIELELNLDTDTMQMIGGKSADGSPFSFTATKGEGGTTGQLMVGEAFR
ncbi:hypothetical protein [Pelagerythrobacter sp.]|uniref:hypothetical protein n=1 Tax=Pelagerythrobacter sp. TaxID=2800702 RepID=UPI0035AED6E4